MLGQLDWQNPLRTPASFVAAFPGTPWPSQWSQAAVQSTKIFGCFLRAHDLQVSTFRGILPVQGYALDMLRRIDGSREVSLVKGGRLSIKDYLLQLLEAE